MNERDDTVERNKQLARTLFEVWNGPQLERIPELYSPDFVADYRPYQPLQCGHGGVREMIERAHATFSGYREEILGLIAEGDRVAVHLRITGVQTGTWGMLPPTGKPVRFEEMLVLRIAGGRIVEQRGIPDNVLALRQVGILPGPVDLPE